MCADLLCYHYSWLLCKKMPGCPKGIYVFRLGQRVFKTGRSLRKFVDSFKFKSKIVTLLTTFIYYTIRDMTFVKCPYKDTVSVSPDAAWEHETIGGRHKTKFTAQWIGCQMTISSFSWKGRATKHGDFSAFWVSFFSQVASSSSTSLHHNGRNSLQLFVVEFDTCLGVAIAAVYAQTAPN